MSYIPNDLDLSNCYVTLDDNTTKTIKSIASESSLDTGGTINGNLIVTGTITSTNPAVNDDSTNVATTSWVNSHPTSLIANSTFANLPSTPTLGMLYLVTNGLKPGEETGSGSGVLCVYDGKNWVSVSAGTTIEI